MARWPRLLAPGFPIHVTQRGHSRGPVFLDELDFARFRDALVHASVRAGCAIHAYALMSNHIHMLLTADDPLGPAQLMRSVGSRFVRDWNRRHRRSGTMWEGRFRSSIVETDRYFLACSRYIDMNPVRAGMVSRANRYAWSSYRHLAEGAPDEVVSPHAVYAALGTNAESRQHAYATFCAQRQAPHAYDAIRVAVRGGAAVGDVQFLSRLGALLQRRVTRHVHGGDRRSPLWQEGPE